MSIHMLSPDVIGKIAAGEVVERPASAVKELVENSLDAGASMITVDIQEGGLKSFRVSDDGCGIQPADIRLAFQRHATSKITSPEDLASVATLGFRGEALASIAAVSRVILTTRTADSHSGIRVINEGGLIQSISDTACAPGTTILVKDLFYNVPVRRDFMKKPAAEAAAVSDLLARFILSRPDVSFRYFSSGKSVYRSPGDGKTESAIISLYGARAFRSMRKVEGMGAGILVSGYVGIGESARGNRGGEFFFINGRMMRSSILSSALEDACRERIMIGKFPVCALSVVMPYESVNVNVHPNKLEVRFRDDQAVRQTLFRTVYEALRDRDAFQRPVEMSLLEEKRKDDSFPAADVPVTRVQSSAADKPDLSLPEIQVDIQPQGVVPEVNLREKPVPVYRSVDPELSRRFIPEEIKPDLLPPLITSESSQPNRQLEVLPSSDIPDTVRHMDSEKMINSQAFVSPVQQRSENLDTSPNTEGDLLFPQPDNAPLPKQLEQLSVLPKDQPRPMKIFGAVFNTFILIEFEDHLLLVDQHAVHERLLFDQMMKAVESQHAGQEMLVPYIVSVTPRDLMIMEENRSLLESIGLFAEPFGEHEVAVRSIPVILGEAETGLFLREALDEISAGKIPGEEKKRAIILQTACKHAVKGGEPLSEEILRSLVEEMVDRKVTPTCPHGRPLVVSISHMELDKKFRRIQ